MNVLSERDIHRFWSKVNKSSSPNGCWVWMDKLTSHGYGNFQVGEANRKAHRVSLDIHGIFPPSRGVGWVCGNRACVNPEHLVPAELPGTRPLTKIELKRFWSFVGRCEEDKCWMWSGRSKPNGYGIFTMNSKPTGAHRIAWIIAHGHILGDLCVCHKCDVPGCVNPSHLFLGTRKDNYYDSKLKSRHAHGAKHANSKLDDDSVKRIREIYKSGASSYSDLSRMFKVSSSVIGDIVLRRSWMHVQ